MKRRSQQFIIAGVIAFLASGGITLVALSAQATQPVLMQDLAKQQTQYWLQFLLHAKDLKPSAFPSKNPPPPPPPVKNPECGDNAKDYDQYNMAPFEKFAPAKKPDMDALLAKINNVDKRVGVVRVLGTEEEQQVWAFFKSANAIKTSMDSELSKILSRKRTTQAAQQATKDILALVNEWLYVNRFADVLSCYKTSIFDTSIFGPAGYKAPLASYAADNSADFDGIISMQCWDFTTIFPPFKKSPGQKVCAEMLKQTDSLP